MSLLLDRQSSKELANESLVLIVSSFKASIVFGNLGNASAFKFTSKASTDNSYS